VYAPDATVPPPFEPVITYGSSESDMALAQSIRRILSADTSLAAAARNMRMSIRDGRVTLTGTTPSENARQIVERTVATIAGVVAVDNQAQVELH
jgi:osmotically-inducible protein OsmY